MDWVLYFFPKTGNNSPAEDSLKPTIISNLKEKEVNTVSCLPSTLFSTYMTQMPQKTHSYFEVHENISCKRLSFKASFEIS